MPEGLLNLEKFRHVKSELVSRGVIAPFPRYELLKSPFPEFAFSPGGDLVIVKQWFIKNPVCERLSKNQRLACRYDEN